MRIHFNGEGGLIWFDGLWAKVGLIQWFQRVVSVCLRAVESVVVAQQYLPAILTKLWGFSRNGAPARFGGGTELSKNET